MTDGDQSANTRPAPQRAPLGPLLLSQLLRAAWPANGRDGATAVGNHYACSCCGYLTLSSPSPGSLLICPVCYWEDDPQRFRDPVGSDRAYRGALSQACESFKRLCASEEWLQPYCRPPRAEEQPP